MSHFACHAPAAQSVSLAGTFNGWDPSSLPMRIEPGGDWKLAVALPPGRYEFKFIVDGEWSCGPEHDATTHECAECVPNSFGTKNRVIEVC
jgi:1,4-alpha-glucan branching enzyme